MVRPIVVPIASVKTVPPPADRDDEEPYAVVERLHDDNERLRLRVLELLKLMEDEVTDKVEAEIRAEDWEHQARSLQDELDALRNTKLLRLASPLRSVYARLRRRG